MRKVVIFILALAVAAFASYVDLTGSVRSGVIAISAFGTDTVFFVAAQDDGKVVVYTADSIKPFYDPAYTWEFSNVTGIPSTGGHTHLNDATSYVFLAPKGAGLKALKIEESGGSIDYGEVSLGTLSDDWKSITGGLAVVDPEVADHVIVFGLAETGKFLAVDVNVSTGGVTEDSTDTGERAYSTMGVEEVDIDGASEEGTVLVYLGTDEAFYVYRVSWSALTTAPAFTFERLKRIPITGKLQSGIAVGESNVYFLTYGLNQMWFNVYNKSTEKLYTYDIPAEAGEALAGFMGNSPVILKYEDGEKVFFAAGKAVYYYDTASPGVDKWADVGAPIYAAPILLEDAANPGGSILAVVTADGKVYRVDFNEQPQLVSDECAGMGTVYSPPVARGGKLVFGVTKPDGEGALCAVDIASSLNSSGALTTGNGWPAFGYLDGRTQVKGYNPPFKITVIVKGYRDQDLASIDKEGPYATYTLSTDPTTKEATFDFTVLVDNGATMDICAVDVELDKFEDIGNGDPFYEPTDTRYVFVKWFDKEPSISSRCRKDEEIEGMRILKASYTLQYRIYHELISDVDGKVIATDTRWATALENYTMDATANYIFVKWEVTVGDGEPQEFTDKSITFEVTAPVVVKEYVKRVYGRINVSYPKVVIEPVPPYNKFLMSLKVTKLSTETAGPDATEIKAFYVALDLSSLPFDAKIDSFTYDLNTSYPDNVSTDTIVDIDYAVPTSDDKKLEIIVSFSTPVVEATDVLIATITVEYTGDGFPYDMDTVVNDSMVTAMAGDKVINVGMIKAAFSKEDSSIGYIPEFLGYTDVLGDFVEPRGCVDIWDLQALVAHFGLKPDDSGWNPLFDIAPRIGFEGPATPGYLIIPGDDPANRVIDFNDILIFAMMYGYCE